MLQSGKMRQCIELHRMTETVQPSGAVLQKWAMYAIGKAELRQASVSEFLTTFGEGIANNAVFVIRWFPGVSVSDRINDGCKLWNIVGIVEIGRRHGLELRAVAL